MMKATVRMPMLRRGEEKACARERSRAVHCAFSAFLPLHPLLYNMVKDAGPLGPMPNLSSTGMPRCCNHLAIRQLRSRSSAVNQTVALRGVSAFWSQAK